MSASSITLDEAGRSAKTAELLTHASWADTILRDGGNDRNSVLRIAAFFSKDLSPEENAAFLRREYLSGRYGRNIEPGGKGYQFSGVKTSVWFDETGITIGRGSSALEARDSTHITWEQAAARVKELYNAGRYVSEDVYYEALNNEKRELADNLWNIYRDDLGGVPDDWKSRNGHPGDVEIIKNQLDDPEKRQAVLARLEADIASPKADSDGRRWHNSDHMLSDLRRGLLPSKGFTAADYQPADFTRFITNGEIDGYLSSGSSFSEGKLRILSHFLHDHTPKERIDFLKREYGQGGGTWIGGGWHEASPSKGISLRRPDCEDVNLTWPGVVKRIDSLIQSGRYFSRAELNRIPEYETLELVRRIQGFFYELPSEYERPFPNRMEFHNPQAEARAAANDFINDREHIDAVLNQMQYIFKNTPVGDRYYNARKEGIDSLLAFREGTFTLFPGLENLPSPEHAGALPRRTTEARTAAPIRSSMLEKPTPASPNNQLSLFDMPAISPPAPPPVLPSEGEQRTKIERNTEQPAGAAEAKATAISLPITQDEIDTALLAVSAESKERITAQFSDNPRSRDAARIVREVYGGIVETMPRLDGEDGYLGILSDSSGVIISRGEPASIPLSERPSIETLTLNWMAVHKRVAELAAEGRFSQQVQKTQMEEAEHEAPPLTVLEPPGSPPPVFFVDWEKAQRDFNLSLYNDRDIIGYDVNGVERRLGRMGSLTYVASTGAFWGSNSVPGDIYEQIEAYKSGELTENQVRDNYLAVLESHKA
ncbi:MAG: hypothetical protein LBS19_03100, partial [Clostridiales bacterium]|nr:hypothetical protein [Clostridiales bacterium]